MDFPINRFAYTGAVVSCKEFGSGHINTTMKVKTDSDHTYILQRINHNVFKNPMEVMENAAAVTEHLRKKDPDPTHSLRFLQTKDGAFCYKDVSGNYWRMYEFVPGLALDVPEQPEDLYAAGLGFGNFQQMLLDFPAHTLHETIPRFHDTPNRYKLLETAIANDRAGRLEKARDLLPWVMEQKALAGTLLENKELQIGRAHV